MSKSSEEDVEEPGVLEFSCKTFPLLVRGSDTETETDGYTPSQICFYGVDKPVSGFFS